MSTHLSTAITSCRRLLILLAMASLAISVGTGCRNKKKDDQQVTEKRTKSKKKTDPIEMEGPSPEELANSPCGNPDWAGLPPGMDAEKVEKKEDASEDEEKDASPEVKPADK